jgi:hypothetical protein
MTGLCLQGVVGAGSLACVARSVVDYVMLPQEFSRLFFCLGYLPSAH